MSTFDRAAWDARIEAKRALAAHFRELDAAVIAAKSRRPARRTRRVTAAEYAPPWSTGRIERKPVAERLRPCVGCGRMTRPSDMTLADAPGTICRMSADRCATCVRAARGPSTAAVVTRPCPSCGRPTRRSDQSVAQAPGTVVRRHGGMCDTCARRRQAEVRS